jgi:hypothetical protein
VAGSVSVPAFEGKSEDKVMLEVQEVELDDDDVEVAAEDEDDDVVAHSAADVG